jgi:hypothetical protein
MKMINYPKFRKGQFVKHIDFPNTYRITMMEWDCYMDIWLYHVQGHNCIGTGVFEEDTLELV